MKDYRKNELMYYVIGNCCVMLAFSGVFKQFWELEIGTAIDVWKVVVESAFLTSIMYSYVFVLDALLSGRVKFKIAYLGIRGMPGCTIFSKMQEKVDDPRFTREDVMKNYEQIYCNMPERNKRQYENAQWNKIYMKHEKEEKVKAIQKDFLLCRDLFIMTLFMSILYVLLAFWSEVITIEREILVVLAIELILTNIAMREQGKGFAYTVIAVDMNAGQ